MADHILQNSGDAAVLVHVVFSAHHDDNELDEFKDLVYSAGVKILNVVIGHCNTPHAKYFVGSGKAEEIRELVAQSDANVVIFNHQLSPGQERNLETLLSCRVIDRTELILDIFAQRARTFEGKLQVELAQLKHLSTRLVRGWTHLERQKGGIGLRGPGETQLETDRRLLRIRIDHIEQRLAKVRRHRTQMRQKRVRNTIPTISIVGYTNAGKSTLFNHLTNADVYVANQLFATLDPTVRYLSLPYIGNAIIADTVGFIRNLPHDLVEAFRSTLEETRNADLLLHVVDAHDDLRHENIKQVQNVLEQIGADRVPSLMVFNKIDLIDQVKPKIEINEEGRPRRVWISARDETGFDLLREAISECLMQNIIHCCLRVSPNEGQIRSYFYDIKAVMHEDHDANGDYLIEVKLPFLLYHSAFEK